MLYYIYDSLYWYTHEELLKWFVDTLGNRFHTNFLVYKNWFVSIRISQLSGHYISVDLDRYAAFVVAKYLGIFTIK